MTSAEDRKLFRTVKYAPSQNEKNDGPMLRRQWFIGDEGPFELRVSEGQANIIDQMLQSLGAQIELRRTSALPGSEELRAEKERAETKLVAAQDFYYEQNASWQQTKNALIADVQELDESRRILESHYTAVVTALKHFLTLTREFHPGETADDAVWLVPDSELRALSAALAEASDQGAPTA